MRIREGWFWWEFDGVKCAAPLSAVLWVRLTGEGEMEVKLAEGWICVVTGAAAEHLLALLEGRA